ncbi:pyroglutamyl-peptidase I [Bdellovibrio sp. HCB274]|uniref:pyroglutamyl-peptidase I family protein n=1 Tax=Bdellovibrio sp. HCB274 TaxID=3394361 RepID=UPI0039B698AC
MKHVLVTGFEPFGDQTINPSERLSLALEKDFPFVTSQILPVEFELAFTELQRSWKDRPFDALVMLGQAGGRNHICLERYAHNWMENKNADRRNPVITPRPISDGAPAALMTSLPVEELRDHLNQTHHDTTQPAPPVSVTLSAGNYVCNYVYFRALQELSGNTIPTLFVHVPYLPEQISATTSAPSMDFNKQLAVLSSLIQILAKK